ncbi:MAG: S8 family serine peptidase, partial [Candidatus Thermoplasmatota archaeon]|nr:S8 family serine peptidase [Candidatus Thermoplasmatota archaeon]
MGTAPDAELVDLRYSRIQGDFTGAADRALEWVIENHEEHDISVTSCSWGSTVTTSGKDTTSRLVDQLVDEGVVVVVAAGNDGEQGLPSPASADGALTIGALDDRSTIDRNDDGHDGYSNRGPRASDGDLDTMDEMKPDVIAPGRDIRSAKHNSVMEYVEMTGTSMATPHVSGIVALMLQANPGLTPSQVKGILRDTAQQKRVASMPEKDDKYNYRSGWGAVDAFGAVKRAGDLISYEVQAPSRVRLDLPFQANVTGHFTKTDHDTQDDVVEMELLTPLQWGPPSDVDLDPGVSGAEVTLGTPSVRGGMWSVRGSVRYAGSVEDVEPVLHAEVRADGSVGDVRTIEGTVSINDVEGSVGPTNVSISYDSLPPDLSIVTTAIWFSDNLPESGDQIDIHARVNNTGGTDVSSVLVRFMDGPERTGRSIGEDIIDVDAFSSAIASSTWEANPGIHAITVIADPENDIAEPDEDNNSAERPITVRGINPPPIAQLEVSPGSGKTITSFFFDASGSTDTNLRGGAVVLYNFDFGDGDSTGWIEDQQVEHLYHSGGSYTASLIVEDNGGAKSQNGANVQINVSEVQSNELTLYLNASSGLSEGPGPARSVLISNGEIGTWSSEPFQLTTILHTEAVLDLKIWSGEEQGITLAGSIGTEHDTFSSEWELEHPGGGNVSFTLGIMMDETEVRYLDTFSLLLEGTTNSEDAMLLAGKDGSMMKVYSYIKENTLPEVDAGPDMDVKAEQEVTFVGSASDTDSGIYWTRWDFDGDGEWDSEGDDALSSDHSGYEEEGSYTARLEVTDRDGGKASDTARVTVRSSDFNYPPSVTMICPSTSEEGILHLQGSSDDDGIVEVVEVRIDGPSGPENGTAISWTEADGTDPWTYSFDTRGMSDGSYTVYARAYDDERYSEIASCSVQIENPNSPPVIERIIVAPRPISLDGEQQLLIKVDISDPDLPMDDVLVSSNLSIIGGPAEVILRDDGTGPDADEEDGTYTLSFIPPISAIPGTYMITITAVDLKGASVQDLVMVEMVSALEVDVDIQDGPYRIGREYLVKVSIENGDTVDRVEMKIGNRTIELKDDGKEGDRVAGDDTYSRRIEIEADPGIVGYEFLLFSSDGSILHSITGELRVEEMLGSSSNDE